MKKALLPLLFLCIHAFAGNPNYCNGGPYIEAQGVGKTPSDASNMAITEIGKRISTIVESQVVTEDSSKEVNGIFRESSSYFAKSQIKSSAALGPFYQIEAKRLENGEYYFNGFVCNSDVVRPFLDSLNRYLTSLEFFLKREMDEDLCRSAGQVKNKMVGWQSALQAFGQMWNETPRYKYFYGEIEKGCMEVYKKMTIAVRIDTTGHSKDPKIKKLVANNAFENLKTNIEEALVNSNLYSKRDKQARAKYECVVKITPDYDSYKLIAEIKDTNGVTVANRFAQEESSLKNKAEHVAASNSLVVKLLNRCGTMGTTGEKYEGGCKNGKREGMGTLTFPNGDFYVGSWLADQPSGKGKMTWASGDFYDGDWKNGKFHGQGTLREATGEYYVGGWVEDLREGKGKLVNANGVVMYDGDWKKGKMDGRGKFFRADGAVEYDGFWKENMRNGKGTLTDETGAIYKGEWRNNLFEGDSNEFIGIDGSTYKGGYKNYYYNGKGKYKNAFGMLYEGNFINGLLNGSYGKITYLNGDVYEGGVKNDQPDGWGKQIEASSGYIYQGEWKDGKCVASCVLLATFSDPRDKKTYKATAVGKQLWMAENLNFNAKGSKCYGNKAANCEKYGRLYDWETAKTACPSGWHLPSQEEWSVLLSNVKNTKQLQTYDGWTTNKGSDDFGFSALPGGGFYSNNFKLIDTAAFWWTSTEKPEDKNKAVILYIYNENPGGLKSNGFSVRCLKDAPPPPPEPEPPPTPEPVPPPPTHTVVPPVSTVTVPPSIPAQTPAPAPAVEKSSLLSYFVGTLMLAGAGVLLYNAYAQKEKVNDYMDEYDALKSGNVQDYDRLRKKANDANDKVNPFLISGGILGVSAIGVFIWF